MWFGSDASRGAAGAFPYDKYSLEELPCSANEGKQLVHDGFAVWRDGAHAVWLEPGGARVLSDRAHRGERPWVPPRPRPRAQTEEPPAEVE